VNRLNIRHRTTYRYREPVQLGQHRLMLRPREGHDLRLLSAELTVTPAASLTWANDVFGNAVATAQFSDRTDGLSIESLAVVELAAPPWPTFDIAATALRYPFFYSEAERIDLAALAIPHHPDPSGWLADWARGFVRGSSTDTLALLKDMVAGVTARISYQSRDEEGTQSPLETLGRGWGSCRDFAVLFVEATRSLGFGARIVSGYLYNPDRAPAVSADAGSTHAWAEIFLPGAGWIPVDPTTRGVGGFHLSPVAVGRVIAQVRPVTGAFVGTSDACQGMSVEVQVAP
jgi:transglutaminase-like putative cysteine protease